MISGYKFLTEEEVSNNPGSIELFNSENAGIQYICYSGVGVTYVITSNNDIMEKISELIRFKFDCGTNSPKKVSLVWTTINTQFSRASTCNDIELDSKRFYQLSEYLVKGVK